MIGTATDPIPGYLFRQWTSLGRTVAVDSQTLVISGEGYTVFAGASSSERRLVLLYCAMEATDKRIRRRKVAAELYASQENEQER